MSPLLRTTIRNIGKLLQRVANCYGIFGLSANGVDLHDPSAAVRVIESES